MLKQWRREPFPESALLGSARYGVRQAKCPVQLGIALYSERETLSPLWMSSWIFNSGGSK
jgi:hypothetical protein